MEAKKADGLSISLPVSDAYLQGSFTFKITREPLWLDEQLVFLGEIPRVNDFENKKPVGEHCLTDGWHDVLEFPNQRFVGCKRLGFAEGITAFASLQSVGIRMV